MQEGMVQLCKEKVIPTPEVVFCCFNAVKAGVHY